MMHENCNGCEALWYSATVPCGCMLRIKNSLVSGIPVPRDECLKPSTDKEYKSLYNKMDRTK